MAHEFDAAVRRSMDDPEGFWADAAGGIDWDRRWDTVLDRSRPPFYRWFQGGVLNTCHNALDRHVEGGRADQTALIYDLPRASRPGCAICRGAGEGGRGEG